MHYKGTPRNWDVLQEQLCCLDIKSTVISLYLEGDKTVWDMLERNLVSLATQYKEASGGKTMHVELLLTRDAHRHYGRFVSEGPLSQVLDATVVVKLWE